MCRKRPFATRGQGRRPVPAAVCRIPCELVGPSGERQTFRYAFPDGGELRMYARPCGDEDSGLCVSGVGSGPDESAPVVRRPNVERTGISAAEFKRSVTWNLRTARMPLFPDALHDDVHVPLIDLADVATGERAVSTGRGAAHELRLLFEGVTGIKPAITASSRPRRCAVVWDSTPRPSVRGRAAR